MYYLQIPKIYFYLDIYLFFFWTNLFFDNIQTMINPVNIHFKDITLYLCKYIKYSHVYKSNKIIIILLDKIYIFGRLCLTQSSQEC